MGSFMSQKIFGMIFFTDCCSQNFLFTEESVFLFHGLSFLLRIVEVNP